MDTPASPSPLRYRTDDLKRYVLNELRDELEKVAPTLASGGLSAFHYVESTQVDVHLPESVHCEWRRALPRVITYLEMAYSPNSSAISIAALEAIDAAVMAVRSDHAVAPATSDNPEPSSVESPPSLADQSASATDMHALVQKEVDPAEALRQVLAQLRESLRSQHMARKCHNELHRIRRSIEDLARRIDWDRDVKTEQWLTMLEDYTRVFREIISPTATFLAHMATNFWRELRTRGINGSQRLHFLLTGNSETVATVLAARPSASQPAGPPATAIDLITVLEGRPKTRHGAGNLPIYIDGARYAETLKHAGCTACVRVIPDAAAATLIARGLDRQLPDECPVSAVVLGANGVYYEPSVMIAHSIGHLSVVQLV